MKLEARELTIHYPGQPRPALDRVSLHVDTGMLYAVLGPNGSGKSSLMKGLLGVIPAEGGECFIGGRPTRDWGKRELARRVGAVSQSEMVAFPLQARELVAMGRYPHMGALRQERPEDREAVEEALARCDALELAHRDVGTLSGGELQRVRIARALAQRPEALVLDEPTASLDIRHEMEIFQLLQSSAAEGLTVLLITHHLSLAARFAHRILLLDEGRVAAEGTPEEVMRADVLERVYRWPVAVHPDPETGTPRVTPLSRP